MDNNATFLLSLLATGMVASLAYVSWLVWTEYKRRKLIEQIKRGEIPVDYDQVRPLSQELNSQVELGNPEFRKNVNDLNQLRTHVAQIRVNGYDRAVGDREGGLKFSIGVQSCPYLKGSGEAKQWVRGYCMGQNIGDPRKYIREA